HGVSNDWLSQQEHVRDRRSFFRAVHTELVCMGAVPRKYLMPKKTNDDKVLPSEVLAGEMSALTLESREHGEVLNAESPADTRSSSVKRPRSSLRPNARSSAGSSSSHEPDGKLYLSKVASLNKDDVVSLNDTVNIATLFGTVRLLVGGQRGLLVVHCGARFQGDYSKRSTCDNCRVRGWLQFRHLTSSEMVSAIPRRHDTRTPEKPRKLSNPRLKGDKLIVRLKLRPSILAQFPTKTKPLEKKPTTKPLIREHNAHQLQFLDQLISEQSTELNRLNQERSITMQNIENYERVCSMHLDTLHRSLADACDLGMTSCELKDGDGDSTRLLKDDIQQMRQGVQNWSRILMEAKQDLASKKHQITMIATSLKTLEEERQQLSQWM
ncbi:unnamed protein product, partial [Fusarium graminearum]